jgi:hypothetical protein
MADQATTNPTTTSPAETQVVDSPPSSPKKLTRRQREQLLQKQYRDVKVADITKELLQVTGIKGLSRLPKHLKVGILDWAKNHQKKAKEAQVQEARKTENNQPSTETQAAQ